MGLPTPKKSPAAMCSDHDDSDLHNRLPAEIAAEEQIWGKTNPGTDGTKPDIIDQAGHKTSTTLHGSILANDSGDLITRENFDTAPKSCNNPSGYAP